jgi:Tat protein secretion system quality control protein TatD with DNase activity
LGYNGGLGFKMKLIDAHIHLSDSEYAKLTDELVAETKSSNGVALVPNSMEFETSIVSLKLAEKYPGAVYPALGIHPLNVRAQLLERAKFHLHFLLFVFLPYIISNINRCVTGL